jgi:hypothetical protein
MSRRGKISLGIVLGLTTILAGADLAMSTVSFTLGTVASYDFGSFGPGYPVLGTVQIQAFTMKPGDTVPWRYHQGVSYVILDRGTLTEQHLVGPDQSASEELTAGSAFVEPPALVHSVTNTGRDVAVIWWATVFLRATGSLSSAPSSSPVAFILRTPRATESFCSSAICR